MAAANYDCNGFFEQRSQIAQMHFGSCKVEAARGIHYSNSSAKESQGIQRIHISNNTYYGHHPAKPDIAAYHDVDDAKLMDCDMAPISQFMPERTLGRKRPSDDVSYASYKRFRQEDGRRERRAHREKARQLADTDKDDTALEELLVGTHGCQMFHFIQ